MIVTTFYATENVCLKYFEKKTKSTLFNHAQGQQDQLLASEVFECY